MKVNYIYPTFQGEVNPYGIGHPVIFLRLQGCHLRCYKRTLGNLCDTPEALKKPTTTTEINSIFDGVNKISTETGIKLVTLTGGDPLWNNSDDLYKLFTGLVERGFTVSVETSGTISWLPFMMDGVHWILDYKLKSAGVKNAGTLFLDEAHLKSLTSTDYIKFVVYDLLDMEEAIRITKTLRAKTDAKIAIGAYWGGKLSTFEIFNILKDERLLGDVVINMQAHKMAVASDFNQKIPTDV